VLTLKVKPRLCHTEYSHSIPSVATANLSNTLVGLPVFPQYDRPSASPSHRQYSKNTRETRPCGAHMGQTPPCAIPTTSGKPRSPWQGHTRLCLGSSQASPSLSARLPIACLVPGLIMKQDTFDHSILRRRPVLRGTYYGTTSTFHSNRAVSRATLRLFLTYCWQTLLQV
jgi:hypothetical protein